MVQVWASVIKHHLHRYYEREVFQIILEKGTERQFTNRNVPLRCVYSSVTVSFYLNTKYKIYSEMCTQITF